MVCVFFFVRLFLFCIRVCMCMRVFARALYIICLLRAPCCAFMCAFGLCAVRVCCLLCVVFLCVNVFVSCF